MFGHYLKLYFRSLKKNWVSYGLSFIGLAFAFAMALHAYLVIKDMVITDGWIEGSENIVTMFTTQKSNGNSWGRSKARAGSLTVLQGVLPKGSVASRYYNMKSTLKNGNDYLSEPAIFVDENFADVFPYDTVEGDLKQALSDPSRIVLTWALKQRLFGNDQALGKRLEVKAPDAKRDYIVGAVLSKPPARTSIRFQAIAGFSAEQFAVTANAPVNMMTFDHAMLHNVIRLSAGIGDLATINAHVDEQLNRILPSKENIEFIYELRPATRKWEAFKKMTSDWGWSNSYYSVVMAITAALLLLAAIVNQVGMSVTIIVSRVRDMGMRRVLGAGKRDLIFQYMGEAIAFSLSALLVAMVIAGQLSPLIADFSNQSASIFNGYRKDGILLLALIAILSGVLSGLYPALVIFRLRSVDILRQVQQTITGGGHLIRQLMIVLQSAASILFAFLAYVAYVQTDYQATKDRGFDYEGLLHIKAPNNASDANRFNITLPQVLGKVSGVLGATSNFSGLFEMGGMTTFSLMREGADTSIRVSREALDDGYTVVYPLDLLAGEMVKKGSKAILIDDFLRKKMAFSSAEAAVGQCLMSKEREAQVCNRVAGVVATQDRNLYRTETGRAFYWPETIGIFPHIVTVRVDSTNVNKVIDGVEAAWDKLYPEAPLQYSLAKENLDRALKKQRTLVKILMLCAGLCVFLALLGVYNQAQAWVTKKRREVALRRVFGASDKIIILNVSWHFLKMAFLGLAIGSPLAWTAAQNWLATMPQRTELSYLSIVGSLACVLLVILLLLVVQIRRAVAIRPATALHHE